MTFELRDALAAQEALQVEAYGGKSPRDLTDAEKMVFITWNILALTDELHEGLAETGWKPWASSDHLNREAFQGEMVDALHFFLNLLIVANIDPDEFLAAYQKKREKNIQRQKDGYDGVSTKCPGCKRALDDDAVACRPISKIVGGTIYEGVFCAETHHEYMNKAGH